ncbi:MAG: glycoside hydrolase family 10 protein [Candidatus Hydrothermia bacterium]
MILLLMTFGGFHRGMWVRASSAASPDSIPQIISMAEELGITDIYYQAVVGGYAYYDSKILPRSQYLSRVSGSEYDPLDSLTKEAHLKGMRVHAWVNSLLIWSGEEPPESTSHVFYTHPDWSVRDVWGRPVFAYSPKTWAFYGLDGIAIDPAVPDVRDWLAATCVEIAENYPVDGVHLDFIRYPGTWWGLPECDESAMFSLLEAENLRWMELVRYPRLPFRERWMSWHFWRLSRERETAVYEAVRRVSDTLRACVRNKPCLLSAAVWANPGAAGYRAAQTWWRWGDIVDYLIVMSYTNDTGLFSDYLDFALSVRPDAVFGIGFLWPSMEAEARWEEQAVNSRLGAGVSYFDYTRLRNEVDRDKLLGKTETSRPSKGKTGSGSIGGTFSDAAPQSFVKEGRGLLVSGEDREFADYLLSLSTDHIRDLVRMGLTRDGFYAKITEDVSAFKAIDMRVFPVGDELSEPPRREISFAFLAYGGNDPEAVKGRAKETRGLPNDTTVYPRLLDPLAKGVFSARKSRREICPVPDGIYVFEVKDEAKPRSRVRRENVPADLLPLYIGWTVKKRMEEVLKTQ